MVVLLVAAGLLSGWIDVEAIQTRAQDMHPGVALALLIVLPVVGFPASVLHVAAGIRFGAAWGLVLVALSIGLQLLVSYAVVHRWRDAFARRFAGIRRRIPPGAHASVCVFAVLLPGAPFAAVNYVLPLIGVRLRTYLLCCWPLHVLRSTVTVLLGGEAGRFSPARLGVLAAYAAGLALGSWWVYRRLRRQLGDPPSAGDDRMQPA